MIRWPLVTLRFLQFVLDIVRTKTELIVKYPIVGFSGWSEAQNHSRKLIMMRKFTDVEKRYGEYFKS